MNLNIHIYVYLAYVNVSSIELWKLIVIKQAICYRLSDSSFTELSALQLLGVIPSAHSRSLGAELPAQSGDRQFLKNQGTLETLRYTYLKYSK